MIDKIVERVRTAREKLLKHHGGLAGFVNYLQAMDAKRSKTKSGRRGSQKLRKS